MKFEFGAARKLYEEKIHPRVMLGPKEVEGLRVSVRTNGARRLMDAMRRNMRPVIDRVLNSEDLIHIIANWNKTWGELGTPVVFGMQNMAMIALLDGNAEALEAVRRVLRIVPQADPVSRQEAVRRLAYSGATNFSAAYDLAAPLLSGKDRRIYTDWAVRVSIPHILKSIGPNTYYCSAGANMPVGGLISAITTILAIQGDPGVPSLGKALEQMLSYLQASLHAAMGPEGYPEEDVSYGTSVVGSLAVAVEQVRRAGLYDAYADCPRFTRFGRAILHFVQPWGQYLTNTGDCTDNFGKPGFVLTRLAAETDDPTLLWLLDTLAGWQRDPKKERRAAVDPDVGEVIVKRGVRMMPNASNLMVLDDLRVPVHPSRAKLPTQFRDSARGIVSFRSGWKENDTYVTFDGSQRSPAGQGHAHASCGNFTLSAMGEYFAIDCGRYANEQKEHNVVLVNGKSGYSHEGEWTATPYAGVLADYVPDDFCDFAAVDSSHQTQCIWARRYLGLVKGSMALNEGGPTGYVWTVEDVNNRHDYTAFWWALNTAPGNKIETFKDHATIHGYQSGNCLDVHFTLPRSDTYPKPHTLKITQDVNKCASYKYVRNPYKYPHRGLHGAVLVRPRIIAKVKGYNGRFMSLMIPRGGRTRPAVVKPLDTLHNSFAVRVTFLKVEDTIIWAYEHNLLEAGDVKGRGQWCVVRRSRKTGRVLVHTLGHGTSLQVSGKDLHSKRV